MPRHLKYVVMGWEYGGWEEGKEESYRDDFKHWKNRLYNVGVYSVLENLRLILTLIKITKIVITIPEEKIKSGL